MWKNGSWGLLVRTENMISTWCGIQHLSFFNAYKVRSPVVVSPLLLCRGFKGSKRNKRDKTRKEKLRLERELEREYGITNKKEFNYKEWLKANYFSEFNAFQARLNIKFNNHKILMSAFAHPSFTEELKAIVRNNIASEDSDTLRRFELNDEVSDIPFQKLSLLGYDTTLLAVKDGIYAQYPNITPSICSDVSRFLTSRETISTVAKNIAIEDLLLLSRELDNVEDFDKEYHLKFTKEDILCDTFYSLIGAIAKDCGLDVAKDFINDFIIVLMNFEDLCNHVELNHPYPELVKILALNGVNSVIKAQTISESGVNTHFPFFHAGIYCNGCQIGEGSGFSAYTARIDAFKNTVFSCLEGDIDFSRLRKSSKIRM